MTKILITGANGQLGTELRNLLDERGAAYDAFDSKDMDITDKQAVDAKFDALKPAVVYHCAAYTAVDKAEDEGKQVNWQVNEDGTRNVATAAKRVGAKLVYISTDYVFDGTNPGEYQVDDPTNPKNEYGKAKLAVGPSRRRRMTTTSSGRPGSLASTARTLFTPCCGWQRIMTS